MAKYFVKKGVTAICYDGQSFHSVEEAKDVFTIELPDSPVLNDYLQEGIIKPYVPVEVPVEAPVAKQSVEVSVVEEPDLVEQALEDAGEAIEEAKVEEKKKGKKS